MIVNKKKSPMYELNCGNVQSVLRQFCQMLAQFFLLFTVSIAAPGCVNCMVKQFHMLICIRLIEMKFVYFFIEFK